MARKQVIKIAAGIRLLILLTMFLAASAFAQLKYVAVIETQINAGSGVGDEVTLSELEEITAEIRRIAVNTLPRGRFSVMTSETVLSMGGAVLEECAEENCVIALGSKIGADYIVRGVVSKFRQNLSLSVEMFETENGMLVASSSAVRTTTLEELLEKGTVACADMFKKFLETAAPAVKPQVEAAPTPAPESKPQVEVAPQPAPAEKPQVEVASPPPPVAAPEPTTEILPAHKQPAKQAKPPKPPKVPRSQRPKHQKSVGAGGVFASDFGGGLVWDGDGGERIAMPYYGGGGYLFFDTKYVEYFAGYSGGGGKWASENTANSEYLPDMSRTYFNFGAFGKFPFYRTANGNIRTLAILGIDYEWGTFGELRYADGSVYPFDGNRGYGYSYNHSGGDLSALWFKFGGGADIDLNEKMYLRLELLYGIRTSNGFENQWGPRWAENSKPNGGHGLSLKTGIGFKFKRSKKHE